MKRTFLIAITFIIFTCASISAIAQSGFTNKDEAKNGFVNSVKEGKWIEYLDATLKPSTKENAAFYRLVIYTNGKENGIARRYAVNGEILIVEIPYTDGKKNGIIKSYYPSGVVAVLTPLNNDVIDGVQKQYYESKKLKWEIPFFKGKTQGVAKEYYENDSLKATITFTDSLRNGMSKEYYEDGEIKWETPYKNGEKNGTEKLFYKFSSDSPNKHNVENIEWETPYTNGKIDGTQTHYDIHGNKTQISFINGKKL